MKRRQFLKGAGAGVAGAAVASPAIAQGMPEIRWRCVSSFPKSLDTLYGTADAVVRRVAELTDNRFRIELAQADEIAADLQAFDAVSGNTVEMAHTASYYYVDKDPTFAIPSCLPFGLNARQQNSWLYEGGGNDLVNEFFRKFNVFALPCGNTGAQMGGWFRKEIKTVRDMQGLRWRIAGIAGRMVAKLGAVPQQIAGDRIYPALEEGTIDAVEWVGPYDDEKLGFYRIAPYYYYPAWWEGGPTVHMCMNLGEWEKLPPMYQAALRAATAEGNQSMLARYDHVNAGALRRLAANGAQLRPFSVEILEASFQAAEEVYKEISDKNEDFKKMYESVRAYRADAAFWFQFSEGFFDRFMFSLQQKKAI